MSKLAWIALDVSLAILAVGFLTLARDPAPVSPPARPAPPGDRNGRNAMTQSEPAPLVVPRTIYDAMLAHCRRESPLECCGVLGGTGRAARTIHPFRNMAASETRFEADPKDVIRAVQELRARGEEFVAIYHSHPQWRAIPSKTDLERNGYGDLPQIIVGLLDDPAEVRAWQLDPASYVEIPLVVVGPDVVPGGGDG